MTNKYWWIKFTLSPKDISLLFTLGYQDLHTFSRGLSASFGCFKFWSLEAVQSFVRQYHLLLLYFVYPYHAFVVGWKLFCFLFTSIFDLEYVDNI